MAPEAPRAVAARRLGDTVYLQLTVPARNAAGPGPYSIDHIDVYAVTIAPGAPLPPNRDLLKPEHVIARIAVRPPPDPEAEAPAEPDKRPLPGDVVTFVEKITPAQLEPQNIVRPPKVEKAPKHPASAAPGAPAVPPPPAGPAVLTRLYTLQGISSNRKAGTASTRVEVPLLAAPGIVRAGTSTSDETSVTVNWIAPASASDEVPGVFYNIYEVPAGGSGAAGVPSSAPVPLNAKPLEVTTYSRTGAEAGKEQCFVVRSVATVGTAAIEGDPSEPMCVTPRDTFAPAAPKGLAAVSGTGVVNLIWDPNTEGDLAGYVVLRGEAPGDTLQPLTPQPIRETRYNDRAVQPGVAYVYAIVAVDRSGNRSAASNKVQETVR